MEEETHIIGFREPIVAHDPLLANPDTHDDAAESGVSKKRGLLLI